MPADWEAHFVDDPTDFTRNRTRLLILRARGDETEHVLENGETYVFTRGQDLEVREVPTGFLVPLGALEAIRKAVERRQGTSLDVERVLLQQRVAFLEHTLDHTAADRDRYRLALSSVIAGDEEVRARSPRRADPADVFHRSDRRS